MNKQKILELTGLSEDQFYDQYPDQETFCSDYPDACNQLEEAQGGMQFGKVYDKYGNETFTPAPDPIHSDWQINDEGMNVRPRTVDRFGNPIGPTTQVLRIPVDRVPFNREPTMQRLNPAMQSLQNESANNVPTTSPIDILTPLIARYNLPKGMMQNSIPIEKLSAKQTMQSVGSTGAPYTAPVNKYKSIVDSLKASGQDSSFASRKKLAEEKGITGYTGTAAQNMALMNAINKGRSGAPLIIPKEQGGTAIFPSMRNFKQGGYYGMDQKFHPNSDSGTYVTGAGYYFDAGGGTTASPASAPGTSGGVDVSGVPGAGSAWSAAGDGSYNINTDFKYNVGNNDESGVMMGDSASEQSSPFDYNSSQFSEQSADKQQPYDQQQPPVYDPSQYSSEIDSNTGFTKYKKNGLAIRNIKREDPTLWNHLKDEGHGARWATGQTDIQRVGRTAGTIGKGLENAVNVAGAIGGYLNNRNQERNLAKSAINKGSTASMFTNPQGSGKGDYGVTGSTYGQFKPNQVSNMSFKGMYGKYGMQVPKYAVGGFEPQLDISEDYKSVGPNQNTVVPFVESYNSPLAPVDNTRADSSVVPLEIREQQTGPLDVDLALQAVSGHESGVKPGQTKVGLKTRIVGEGGKRASASGTYQITTPTLQQIYKNDKNINSAFNTFNQFKSAFDTDPKVEYAAAKSLMSDHIKNYGVYALGAWYYPAFAKRAMQGDKSVFNIKPRKDYGNNVEWGTDFKNKLNSYNKLAGTNYDISSAISIKSPSVNIKSPSVNIKNLNPDLLNFTNVISQNFPGLVLTSGNDSKHMKGSKHYSNKAIDIGANSSNKQSYLALKNYLKQNPSIKKQYGIEDIIDEGNHIHVELMKYGGQQQGGQVVEMDENQIQQFLAAGGQLEFLD